MLLSDPFVHGSLETPVNVQGKATIKIEHKFEAYNLFNAALDVKKKHMTRVSDKMKGLLNCSKKTNMITTYDLLS